MRIAAPIVASLLAVVAGVVARATPSRPPQDVPCDEIIHHTKFHRSLGDDELSGNRSDRRRLGERIARQQRAAQGQKNVALAA